MKCLNLEVRYLREDRLESNDDGRGILFGILVQTQAEVREYWRGDIHEEGLRPPNRVGPEVSEVRKRGHRRESEGPPSPGVENVKTQDPDGRKRPYGVTCELDVI